MPTFRHKNNLAIAAILFATVLLTDALVGTTPLYALAALAGPTYQRIPECLVYRCTVCGYREERPTVDATPRPTGIPTPSELEKWRERWLTTPNLLTDPAKEK